jgi:hypothetical protein
MADNPMNVPLNEVAVADYIQHQLQAMRQQITAELTQQINEAQPHAISTVKPSKPQHFSGDRSIDVDVWLFQLEQFMTLSAVSDNTRVPLAATFLDGSAATWWRMTALRNAAAQLSTPTWDQFKHQLRQQFKPVNSAKIARDRLHMLRQTTSVARYNSEFNRLVLEAGDVSETEQRHRYIQGLKPDIRMEIELADPQTVVEAMEKAQRVDNIAFQLRTGRSAAQLMRPSDFNTSQHTPMELGTVRSPSPNSADGEALNAMSRLRLARPPKQHAAPAMSREEYARCRREGLCLKCKKPGHVARFCKDDPAKPSNSSRQLNGKAR